KSWDSPQTAIECTQKQRGVDTIVRKVSSKHYETSKEGHAVPQQHHGDWKETNGIYGRGTARDEGAPPRVEGGRAPRAACAQGGRGKRRAREDRRTTAAGSSH